MDIKKVKELRNKLAIPLDVALLLKKNKGDVLLSMEEHHNNNINEISLLTACELDIARENYNQCNFDKTKAISKINSIQTVITSNQNPTYKNEIGFILWPENVAGENYKTAKRNDAFIPTSDFDYIVVAFKSVFPLMDPWNKTTEEELDVCGHNYIDIK